MKLDKLRVAFKDFGIDGLLVTAPDNRYYMSGFTGTAGILAISQADAVLVTDFRYIEQAKQQATAFRAVMHGTPMLDTLNSVVNEMGISRLGFEAANITYDEYGAYSAGFVGPELVPTKGLVERLRMIKSEEEVENIAGACRIADKAFDHILGYLKPGLTELEVATELEVFMLRLGHKPSFDFIVASGERSALPHGRASHKVINLGEFVTLDFGCMNNRYCSDMTRTVVIGRPTDEQRRVYDLVLEAQLVGVHAARAGLRGCDVDRASREIIERAGHGEHFGHGLGHSLGLAIHEDPRFRPVDETIIEPGMVLSVEPGVYIPGWGGVRIEDLVVITDGPARVLTSSPKELIQV